MQKNTDAQNYRIRIRGQLDERWQRRFTGLTLSVCENGDTVISGTLVDQSALHGVLNRIRDLGLELISVRRINAADDSDLCSE